MTPIEAIRLRFITPLHIGRGMDADMSRSDTLLHSDTLKSALYATGHSLFSSWRDPDYYFNGFSISSCFPYADGEYFLPRPHLRADFSFTHLQEDESGAAKAYKRISYLSLPQFREVLAGMPVKMNRDQLTRDGEFVFSGPAKRPRVFSSEVQQRVLVPRAGQGDSEPYYVDRLYFEEDCGFYFLASFSNDKLRSEVLQALALLGEKGIGTDKSVGNGLFYFNEREVEKIQLGSAKFSGRQMALGLYLPAPAEVEQTNWDAGSWNLLKRGGYMGGSSDMDLYTLRRKSVYMFTEGSVFHSQTPLHGKYLDLKPEWNGPIHPVWRDGQPLFIYF